MSNAPNYGPLWHWIKERELIRQRREPIIPGTEPHPPFTDDPILATYRFCNVRREDDRVTRWIKANIREKFAGHEYLWFMLCLARQINWPETLVELSKYPMSSSWPGELNGFTPEALAKHLNDRADRGEKVFTGAYIITAPSKKGAKKTDHVALVTLGALWKDRKRLGQFFTSGVPLTMRGFHARLMDYNGWGPFLAYQAVVDMRFTPLLENATDRNDWAAAGPGTIRGLNRLYGRKLEQSLSQGSALSEMRSIFKIVTQETGVEMDFSDVPNILCETDKYLRVKNGEGKPRALWVPGRGS